jgi:hypothetical protein
MRTLICLVLAALLSGCLPIGIRGTSMPQSAGERPIVAAVDDRDAAAELIRPYENPLYETRALTSRVRIYSHAWLPTPRPNEFGPTKPALCVSYGGAPQ